MSITILITVSLLPEQDGFSFFSKKDLHSSCKTVNTEMWQSSSSRFSGEDKLGKDRGQANVQQSRAPTGVFDGNRTGRGFCSLSSPCGPAW